MSLFMLTYEELQAILISLKVASLSTIISLPVALLTGWVLARKNFWGKSIVDGLIHLPMVMPPVTTGYILLILLGTNGIIGRFLFNWFHIQIAFSFTAVVIASIIVSVPLMIRAIRTAFEMIDPAFEDTAKTLGDSGIIAFLRVSVPLAMPGIVSGTVLCFARSLGEFGATISFAGNIQGKTQTIALAIYEQMQIPNHEEITVRLVIISASISLIAMIFAEYINKNRLKKRI